MACTYIPAAALTPWLVSRYGLRRAVRHAQTLNPTPPDDDCFTPVRTRFRRLNSRSLDSVLWHRYIALWQQSLRAANYRSGVSRDPFAPLLRYEPRKFTRFIWKFFASLSQAVFQVLPTKYSELWFNIRGRTTATMVMAIMNPIGGALAQVIAPLTSGPRQAVRTPCPYMIPSGRLTLPV